MKDKGVLVTRFHIYHCAMFGVALSACGVVDTPTSSTEQAGTQMQGTEMQGTEMQGMAMQGIRIAGATLDGTPLTHVRVERGEVVAQQGSTTLRGKQLARARFLADMRNIKVTPPRSAVVQYRVAAIDDELPRYDPDTGNTYLYTLEQWVDDTSSWQPACPADGDGRRVAIPLAATWDEHGDRIASSARFTFACTTGVIAKCYRWGYRPWVTGYGDLTAMHWTCTRLARADYCGIGQPRTRYGTEINVWDKLPFPGPIQGHGGVLPPPGMLFEAGWNTGGAVCLSHARWIQDDGAALAALCPSRLVPPGLGETVCNTLPQALGYDANAQMFNEAYLNVDAILGLGLGL